MSLAHLATAIVPAPVTDPNRIVLTTAQAEFLRAQAKLSDFYASFHRQWALKGFLSPKQVACIDRDLEKLAAPTTGPAAAPRSTFIVPLDKLNDIFSHARRRGVNQPTIRLQTAETGYKVYSASALSANSGALYVKDLESGTYLGKIAPTGHFLAVRGTDPNRIHADLVTLLSDPELNARRYGADTGMCSICGRLLTDPVSIAQSMGPICAGRYGF